MTGFFQKVLAAVKRALEMIRPDHPREVDELKRHAEALYLKYQEKVRKAGGDETPEPQQDPFAGP